MSREQSLQPAAADGEQGERLVDVPRRACDLERLPLRLFAVDMAAIFGISVKRFYQLASEGAFDFAVNRPRIGRESWSRERVRQYFAGELRGLTPVRKRA